MNCELNSQNFAPTCNKETWIKRQKLMSLVRNFFANKNILEVETPTLSAACGTDPELDYFSVKSPERFLMTSPEFHMKRLLSAGFGDIFQITKAFRKDEFGAHHNNEFSIVEWYRVGMPQSELMSEVESLVSYVTKKTLNAKRTRWIDAFKNYTNIDPLKANSCDFIEACISQNIALPADTSAMSKSDWWDYFMVFVIEPKLAKNYSEFIYDYPPEQAALAQTYVDSSGYTWAKRFELFVDNVELCNGYTELTDAIEQRKRFAKDLQIRKNKNRPLPLIDENFLQALEHGMPACSGVALGLDRLFMLALNKKEIKDVILFPSTIA